MRQRGRRTGDAGCDTPFPEEPLRRKRVHRLSKRYRIQSHEEDGEGGGRTMNKMEHAIPATMPWRNIRPPREEVEKLARRTARELSVTPRMHVFWTPIFRRSHSDYGDQQGYKLMNVMWKGAGEKKRRTGIHPAALKNACKPPMTLSNWDVARPRERRCAWMTPHA